MQFIMETINYLPGNWRIVGWIVVVFVAWLLIVVIVEACKLIFEYLVDKIAEAGLWVVVQFLNLVVAILLFPFRKIVNTFHYFNNKANPSAKTAGKEEQKQHPINPDKITYKRAIEIFDLEYSDNFTYSDLKKRYRSIIGKLHPDRGGSNFFTKQANEAREVIKKHKGW